MLTLTRKPGQDIEIQNEHGDIIMVIVIKEIRRNQVRVGIEAPRDLTILRGEIADEIRKQQDPA